MSHLWADISPIVIRSLEDIVAASPSFDLTDARIETLSAAIILRFAPSPVLESLRDKIMKIESLDKVIAYRPNLTHITLFRFERAIPLGPLADAVSAIDPPELCWTVDRLVLQQENVYPSLQSTALAAFILGGRSKHLGS